jgi:hypothetical protein
MGPDVLFRDQGTDAVIRDNLETADEPKDADDIGLTLKPDQHLGDCVSFSKYLIWLESRDPIQHDYFTNLAESHLDFPPISFTKFFHNNTLSLFP